MIRQKQLFFISIFVIAALLLGACDMLPGQQTNTGNAVQTAAAQTVVAQQTQVVMATVEAFMTQMAQATQAATTAPTNTPQPTITNTPETPLPTATVTPSPTVTMPPATITPYRSVTPVNTVVVIPCNRASFVTDVTIPDGTTFDPGASFTKTWRLQNTGSCTWDTNYAIIFDSGNAMNAATSVKLTSSVAPGATIDVSVPMVAPATAGTYEGKWKLQAGDGTTFGIGASGAKTFWVKINVNAPVTPDPSRPLVFSTNYCKATWTSNKGTLSCPSSDFNFTNGSIMWSNNAALEDGSVENEPALLTLPDGTDNGYIQGKYPTYKVQSGDHFVAGIGCLANSTKCSVIFQLAYQIGSDPVQVLGTWAQTSDGSYQVVNVDLSGLAGKDVNFILFVDNQGGDNTDDRAFWLVPRIQR